ncbi:DNA topoisomerase IB, partial [Streptosporangium algeriense]
MHELRRSDPAEPGITRRRRGRSFTYAYADGRPVRDRGTLARIRALALPPAW